MTIKQQIKHGSVQKVCHLYNGIFHHIHLCHTLSLPLCYSLKIRNYRMREKIFCIYYCFSISRYIKGGRKSHFLTQLKF